MPEIPGEWQPPEIKIVLAALDTYWTKQEKNRDKLLEKFGPNANTAFLDHRIATIRVVYDRLETALDGEPSRR